MNTASTAAQQARGPASKTAEGERDSVQDAGTTAASAGIEGDLQALRSDFARLAEQFGDILAGKGDPAWQRAKASLDDLITDAEGAGRDAAGAARDVSGHFIEVVDELLKDRPYATLAIAAGLGFLLGAMWRR